MTYDGRSLLRQGTVIDLVHNRLVDFLLEAPGHTVLRTAYRSVAVVLTPNPHVHALLANKRNLVTLSNPDQLKVLGASAKDIEILQAVPSTRLVTPENAGTIRAKPGERSIKGHSDGGPHKMVVRLYTYAGEVLLIAARVYRGQTTNFRTPGGGFSPLFVVG